VLKLSRVYAAPHVWSYYSDSSATAGAREYEALKTLEPKIDELLRTAIEHRRIVALRYGDRDRIVEPHDYGVHNGSPKLLAYQIGGASSGRLPNWRWMDVDLISEVQLLDKTFPGGRPTPSGKHYKWDRLFIRVQTADEHPNIVS